MFTSARILIWKILTTWLPLTFRSLRNHYPWQGEKKKKNQEIILFSWNFQGSFINNWFIIFIKKRAVIFYRSFNLTHVYGANKTIGM